MRNVDVNIGKACNLRCRFCSNGDPLPEELRWADAAMVEAEIRMRRREGAESVGFLGGEPTLYPHLERIVRAARELGFSRIALCTNGTRLADADLLERLLDAGVTRVAVSIHSHCRTVEDHITRRPGSFERKVLALRNLVAAERHGRLPDGVSLNTVLHRRNVEHLDRFVRFVAGLGIGSVRFNLIRPCRLAEGNKTWVPRFSLVTPNVLRVVRLNESLFHLALNFGDLPFCKYPRAVLGNPKLRRRYVGEGWDLVTDVSVTWRHQRKTMAARAARFNWQRRRLEFKSLVPTCRTCALRDSCEGVWQKYLDLYGDREFAAGPAFVAACLRDDGPGDGGTPAPRRPGRPRARES
ncbi:MAG: radical SAM protein [Deltaproteobacteria bacterium]|nr:radical SAM protein [Deltaproteobacteria bacterium]